MALTPHVEFPRGTPRAPSVPDPPRRERGKHGNRTGYLFTPTPSRGMDDQERVKAFIKAWARYSVALTIAEKTILKDLETEVEARVQVQMILATELGDESSRRRIAFELALAEHELEAG